MQALGKDRQVEEARLALVFGVFLVGLAAGSLGRAGDLLEAVAGAVLAYLVTAALVYLWGERTRPKVTVGWMLLIIAWLIVLMIMMVSFPMEWTSFWLAVLTVLPPALLARHENGIGPTVIIALGVVFALVSTGSLVTDSIEGRLGDDDAMWVATAAVFAVAAGTIEHERLARRTGPGTPVYWTAFRLAFVTVWTIVILSLREQVQWGRLFLIFGADLTGQAGQILLIGLIVVAVAVAAYAFRPNKGRQGRG